MDYTTISLADVRTELEAIAADADDDVRPPRRATAELEARGVAVERGAVPRAPADRQRPDGGHGRPGAGRHARADGVAAAAGLARPPRPDARSHAEPGRDAPVQGAGQGAAGGQRHRRRDRRPLRRSAARPDRETRRGRGARPGRRRDGLAVPRHRHLQRPRWLAADRGARAAARAAGAAGDGDAGIPGLRRQLCEGRVPAAFSSVARRAVPSRSRSASRSMRASRTSTTGCGS